MRLLFVFILLMTPSLAKAATKTLAVVLVEFPGLEAGMDENEARDIVWGSGGVASAFNNYSFGKFNLKQPAKSVLGPVTVIPKKGENCDKSYRAWSERALEMLQADKVRDYNHLVFIFPPAEMLGCSVRARGELFGSLTWIFGASVNTIIHELGHNLGLGHAASDLSGSTVEYGDDSSPMGYTSSQSIFFNAPQMLQLKWISQGSIYNIRQSGSHTVSLFPLESHAADQPYFFINIQTPAPRKNYLVSYRKIPNPMLSNMRHFQKGASIHLNKGLGKQTVLVSTLSDGESFFDPDTGLRIIQRGHSNNSVELEISLPGSEDYSGSPQVSSPLHDFDNDGVENSIDCAPYDSSLWNSAVSFDSDNDGLPDSLMPASLCFGAPLPAGHAEIGSGIDNCPTIASRNMTDTNWDGIGDICTESSVIERYKAEAMLRQAEYNLSLISKKTGSSLQKKIIASSLNLVSQSLKFHQKEKDLLKIRNILKSGSQTQSALKPLRNLIKRLGIAKPGQQKSSLEIRRLPCSIVKAK